ncbi:MAG: hypothetical protein ABIP40_11860, partial [Bacteroidia bacterium]
MGILLVTTEIKSQVWNKIAELPHGAAILDMAVDNSNIIYALTSANDIYYTSTNALSWTKMPGTDIFFGIRDIELDKTSNVLYVSTELQGIHWTPNKGLSWQNHPIYTNTITGFNAEINSTVRKPNSNIIICNDPEIGYSQIHRSTNAGLNWVTTFETFEIAYTLKYLANNTLLAGTELGIYKSLNDGVSWNPSNIGMVNFTVKSILEKNTISKIFAAADLNINTQDTTGCGVFVSNDGGASWTKTSAGMTDCRINCLTMDNSGNLYATYPGGVYRSTNNGVTWSAINSGLGQNNEYATITSNNSGLFAGSKRSGVAFSTMPVNNWTFRNSGMRVKTIGHMLLSNTGTIYT